LALPLGNAPTFTGVCENQPFPLAVQVARLFGPLLLVITALAIAAALFRAQLDRLVVRFSRSLIVMVGLTEEALPLVRRLASDLPRGTVLTWRGARHRAGARLALADPFRGLAAGPGGGLPGRNGSGEPGR
jgi:hypothetical protein